MSTAIEPILIFDFTSSSNVEAWRIVDDGVMGGVSNGNFQIDEEGHGRFFGQISLDNYGGFSSLRYQSSGIEVKDKTAVRLRVKGDGKNFQFRIKDSYQQYYSFIYEFETSGKWEDVVIPLAEMYPSFRGRKLDLPNFSGTVIQEVTFLRGNKRYEDFSISIDKIELI